MVDKNVFVVSEEELEKDRNARGYGFEIGRGHPLTTDVDQLSEDNPFTDKNWRDNIIKTVPELTREDIETFEIDEEGHEIEKTKTDDPFAGMKRAGEKNGY